MYPFEIYLYLVIPSGYILSITLLILPKWKISDFF